jgi:hypothetical protein
MLTKHFGDRWMKLGIGRKKKEIRGEMAFNDISNEKRKQCA